MFWIAIEFRQKENSRQNIWLIYASEIESEQIMCNREGIEERQNPPLSLVSSTKFRKFHWTFNCELKTLICILKMEPLRSTKIVEY